MTINYVGATEQTKAVVHHHAVLRRGLERRVGTLCDAVENGVPHEQALMVLCKYLTEEVLPHAEAEERTLYLAATADTRGSDLVRTLADEHSELAYLVDRLRSGVDGSDATTMAEWIATLFASHAAKENDLLLPLLSSSEPSLATLLSDTHRPHAAARASQ